MAQSAILHEIEFHLSGNLAELERLAREIALFCRQAGLGDSAGYDLNLALEELFANAVRHGGCAGIADVAAIRLASEGRGEVTVEYRDRGLPFNPLEAPPADVLSPLVGRAPGGLGIHLVRQVMRDLEYHRIGDWNRLTMRRPVSGGEVLRLNRETRSGWCVVAVGGRADAESADQLETALRAAIGEHPKVAADLNALDYISSAGLRALLQAARAAQSRGSEFAVVCLSAPVRRVFDMSGMHHIVRIEGELPC